MAKLGASLKRKSTPYQLGELRLHVIGAGKGESIVVHMPNDKWGVVDCYAHQWNDKSTNPTLQFLKEESVKSLEFICVTHPHADHFRGVDHLFEEFPVEFFWRYSEQTYDEYVHTYLQVQAEEGVNLIRDKLTGDAESFLRMMVAVQKMPENRVLYCGRSVPLYPYPQLPLEVGKPNQFIIESLAPCDEVRKNGFKNVVRYIDAAKKLKPRKDRPDVNPNDMSAALLIKYGKTRIILGGDVEENHWLAVTEGFKPPDAALAAHAVKVSHHGSGNANPESLWKIFCANGKPAAVMTRFPRLPKKEIVNMIKKYAAPVLCTSIKGLAFAGAPPLPKPKRFGKPYDALLATALREWTIAPNAEQGMWSFSFDNNGNCLASSGDGDAGIL
jgi:beta-lactamase superfamily II metal-dependent hydrolase